MDLVAALVLPPPLTPLGVPISFFALPLTGLLAAYLILARPPWFREWVERLYTAGSS